MRGRQKNREGKKQEEAWKNRARTFQTALWVSLILVQMTIVNSLTVQAATQPVEKTVTYRRVEGAASLPEQMTVTVKADGSSYEAVCEAVEKQVLKEYWLEDFTFPVTFHSYDSQYFQIGEQLIPYNAEQPGLEDCGMQLLDMLGLSAEEYQVDSVVWNGAPYWNEEGVLCRDGLGAGRRLVRDYEVRYVGSISLPEGAGPKPHTGEQGETSAVTEETEPESSSSQTIPQTKASEVSVGISEEPEDENAGKQLTLWQIITRTMLAAVGIGVILFFGGLVVLLIRKIRRLWKRY